MMSRSPAISETHPQPWARLPLSEMFPGAQCIWKSGWEQAYNCHLRFRHTFHLPGKPIDAQLRISASDKYRLFLNGEYIEEGPARAERGMCYVDIIPGNRLPLREGSNTLAILSQNKNLAEHGQPPKPGALVASLILHFHDGREITIATGPSWKVDTVPGYLKPAPRRFFPVGFNDFIDFRSLEQGWEFPDYDDAAWSAAVPVSDEQMRLCFPRPLPFFEESFLRPERLLRRGHVGPLDGIFGLNFLFCRIDPSTDPVRFRTFIHSDRLIETAYLYPGCDNQSTIRLNDQLLWEQGDGKHGFRKHMADYELAWYDGMFHGHGLRFEPTPAHTARTVCRLEAGWNELEIEIHYPDKAYGFEMAFFDPSTHVRIPLRASCNRSTRETNTWSTQPAGSGSGAAWQPVITETTDIRPFLEPSHLGVWDEQMVDANPVPALDSFELAEGEFIDLELADYGVGYLELVARGEAGSILDLALSERIHTETGRVLHINNGLWQGERLILSGGEDRWLPLERRAGRYLNLTVRKSSKPVVISASASVTCAIPPPAAAASIPPTRS